MKQILPVLLTLGILAACTSTESKQNEEVISDTVITAKVKPDFKNLDTTLSFSGYYLSEDYYKRLLETKSPKSAQLNSEDCYIKIPARTLEQTMMIYNFHEGGDYLNVVFKDGKFELWKYDDDKKRITDFFSGISLVSSNKIKIGDKVFIKFRDLSSKADDEEEDIVLEELLFNGKYQSEDGKTIEFTKDGQVVGLENFKYYRPISDYFDAGMDIDQVGLSQTKSTDVYYGFKFKKDSLLLYTIDCLEFDSIYAECTEVNYGELKYKLIKMK